MIFGPQFATNPGMNVRANITTTGQMPNMGSATADNGAAAGSNASRNNNNMHTRFQFIVPGGENVNEQFDLYG
jgi:hypothetical protein